MSEDLDFLLNTIEDLRKQIKGLETRYEAVIASFDDTINMYQRAIEPAFEDVSIKDRIPSVITQRLIALMEELELEKRTNDNGGWAWIRDKIQSCCPQDLHNPRGDELLGTKYEVMGWMHVLCSHISQAHVFNDIAIEHQKKYDELAKQYVDMRSSSAEEIKVLHNRVQYLLSNYVHTVTGDILFPDGMRLPCASRGPLELRPGQDFFSICESCGGALNYKTIGIDRPPCRCDQLIDRSIHVRDG